MAIEFTKATSFLKGTVTASFRTMTQLVKDANSEHKFNEWIHNEQKQWAIKAGSAEAEQTAESIRFFFKLVAGFVFQYTHERSFIEIGLIADQQHAFGSLPIKDYFIQLAYMTSEEASNRSSLLQTETEINRTKIRKAYDQRRQLDKTYLQQADFRQATNLLVLGSPGVGKTTFCRWFCAEWATQLDKLNGIPVYIELKRLRFGGGENPIVQYIINNYVPALRSQSAQLHELMKKLPDQFFLILDGYDELPEENKKQLASMLIEVSSNSRFLLSSRPYGILETYGLSWNETIQINGFDAANINQYIDRFVGLVANRRTSSEELRDIIRLNPTLSDFAPNPLLLSFMVFIYLADEQASERLRTIESRFGLQELVMQWVFQYHNRKGLAPFSMHVRPQVEALAFKLEMAKQVETIAGRSLTVVQEVMQPVATVGLGQLTSYSTTQVRFYFSTLTFQEYLAACYLGPRLTVAAFTYLIQDSFFWNLAAMLVGQLTSQPLTRTVLDQLMHQFETSSKTYRKDYAYFQYVLLISECDRTYLADRMNSRRLQQLLKGYLLYGADNRLRYGIAESVQRIYHKLPTALQQAFQRAIHEQLSHLWHSSSGDGLLRWNEAGPLWIDLIRYLELADQPSFISQLLTSLRDMLTDLQQKRVDDENYVTIPSYLIELLRQMPARLVAVFDAPIRSIIPLIPDDELYDKASLAKFFQEPGSLLHQLEQSIASFDTCPEEEKQALGDQLALLIFYLGEHVNRLLDAWPQELVKNIIQGAVQRLIDENWFDTESVDTTAQSATSYTAETRLRFSIEGLLQFKSLPDLYALGLELIFASPDLLWEIDEIELINRYLEQYTLPTKSRDDATQLIKLCRLFSQVPSLKNYVITFREQLLALVDTFVDKHYAVLTDPDLVIYMESGIAGSPEQVERMSARFDPVLTPLYAFHGLLDSEDIYESDKRYMVDWLLANGYSQLAIYRINVLPQLMRQQYIFSPLSWQYIFESLDGDLSLKEKTFQLLTNESIYQFGGNYPFIEKLLEQLVSWRQRPWFAELIERCQEDILLLLSEGLLMLKKLTKANPRVSTSLTDLVRVFLSLDIYREDRLLLGSGYDGRTMSVYILHYFFTRDSVFIVTPGFYNDLSRQDPDRFQTLLEVIYDLFSERGQFSPADLADLTVSAGKRFVKKLTQFALDQYVFNFPFSAQQLESLLTKPEAV